MEAATTKRPSHVMGVISPKPVSQLARGVLVHWENDENLNPMEWGSPFSDKTILECSTRKCPLQGPKMDSRFCTLKMQMGSAAYAKSKK